MDSYIVRIYRQEKDNTRMLVGLIQEVGSKGKMAFASFDDLWEILNQRTHLAKKSRNKSKRAAE